LKIAPPKSTGREYYGQAYVKKVLALGRQYRASPNDLIRAATIFTALSVVDALHRFVLPKTKIDQLIVSGGGAHNRLILAQLSALLSSTLAGAQNAARLPSSHSSSCPIEILPSSHLGIPEDAKESFAFAIFAYETFHQRPANLPSATGACGPAILGKISYAPPR
jgi:anhydro-N-acetylmuramic acid kinase